MLSCREYQLCVYKQGLFVAYKKVGNRQWQARIGV